jgi:pimeloyl-ACP methyl ester carboxylesterase
MKIVYVHGASSTPLSFNYIAQNLPEHERLDFSYDTLRDIEKTVYKLYDFLPEEEHCLVAHSMGGLVSVAVTYLNALKGNSKKLSKMIIISSPIAGSKIANYLRWMYPKYGLFDNVSTNNPVVLTILERGAIIPTLNIITKGGESPVMNEENDGVITVASQLALRKCSKIMCNLNHFEVLLADETVKAVKEYLW